MTGSKAVRHMINTPESPDLSAIRGLVMDVRYFTWTYGIKHSITLAAEAKLLAEVSRLTRERDEAYADWLALDRHMMQQSTNAWREVGLNPNHTSVRDAVKELRDV